MLRHRTSIRSSANYDFVKLQKFPHLLINEIFTHLRSSPKERDSSEEHRT
jgi:hypothetical protein